ncbi:hypothetical protein SARC_12618 [Sphaeroforma arctica JP610]|uniref:Fucolectin tachylectin-4 pentraxin-1 domain-containing protein n=1 Tax=Sphaeroforma arctica JP610 TaxID=667725 RepID=A0A0L0FED3_9EUKA|nr:hypothetical protein SARC_12618 [Sphaeroforma arctica JP610]KNC74846.1 hypothetical protein SARC_12618 [Sphaeroforma arctica JP610]|eukprot:XP_014148748.1 hypothetical protein SARC_12618 [Sphaeroforma arctica JP610]
MSSYTASGSTLNGNASMVFKGAVGLKDIGDEVRGPINIPIDTCAKTGVISNVETATDEELNPWWKVELPEAYNIYAVRIFNQDSDNLDAMNNVTITISNSTTGEITHDCVPYKNYREIKYESASPLWAPTDGYFAPPLPDSYKYNKMAKTGAVSVDDGLDAMNFNQSLYNLSEETETYKEKNIGPGWNIKDKYVNLKRPDHLKGRRGVIDTESHKDSFNPSIKAFCWPRWPLDYTKAWGVQRSIYDAAKGNVITVTQHNEACDRATADPEDYRITLCDVGVYTWDDDKVLYDDDGEAKTLNVPMPGYNYNWQ